MSFLLFCYPVKFSFHTRQLSLTRIINEHIKGIHERQGNWVLGH